MKKFACAMLAVLFMGLVAVGCKDSANTLAKARQQLHYFKDVRTDICFAYTWSGGDYGGPAMSAVPCDKVANFLER